MKFNDFKETFSEDSPKDLFPIIGFLGFVFMSTTGAKLKLTPILLQCSAILRPTCIISLLSFIAPKVIFHGNANVESNLIFKPHSASIPINKGTDDSL